MYDKVLPGALVLNFLNFHNLESPHRGRLVAP